MSQFGMSQYVMRVKEELYRDIPNCNIQHKNAPEDGLLKSEIC